jgi:hypothetical protein
MMVMRGSMGNTVDNSSGVSCGTLNSMIQIDWHPDRKKLRQFSVVFLLGMVAVGSALGLWRGAFEGESSWAVPVLLWALGLVVGLSGLVSPTLARPVYLAWMGLAFPIGWLTSHLFLGVVYLGLFTPLALLFRIIGRDPLQLRKRRASTYWIDRRDRPSSRRYFQQF